MSTGKPHLTEAECLAMGDEWAMLSRRSEKWVWLMNMHRFWQIQQNAPGKTFRTSTLQSFLDQRHALSKGWNTAYRNDWVTKFNDFYIFALTQRIAG